MPCKRFHRLLIAASALALLSSSIHAQLRSKGVALQVRVSSHRTEAVLEGVQVEVIKFPSEIITTGFTDSTGHVEFTLPETGAYIVRASKSGFRDGETRVDVNQRDRTAEASIAMDEQEQDSSSPGGQVSARMLALPAAAKENFQKGIEALQAKKDPQKSLEFFQKAIAIAPDFYEAHFLAGMAHAQLKSAKEAELSFRKAIELKQDFMHPYYPLALLLFGEKRNEEEETLLRQAIERDGQNWQWPFEMARSLASHGAWEKAIEYGHQAGAKPGAPSKVHLLMGDLYSSTGHNAEAIAELEQFKKIDPKSTYMPKVDQALTRLRSARSETPAEDSQH